MSPRLVLPAEAAERVAAAVDRRWAELICAVFGGAEPDRPIACPLRPGVTGETAVLGVGLDAWNTWRAAWRALDGADLPGVRLEHRAVNLARVPVAVPFALHVEGLDAAVALLDRLGGPRPAVDVDRARSVAARLRAARVALTPAVLTAAYRQADRDVDVLIRAATWLAEHADLGGWTARQLPVPGMDSKWVEAHGGLLRVVVGRDLRAELRARPAVVHLTYVDPDYLATGRRRHDAWTTGDRHEIAYRPHAVLVVENRDSRLWFPPAPGTIVVEGGGKAAAALLAEVPWLRGARVFYWGDMDGDGYAILDGLRGALAAVTPGAAGAAVRSILMDVADLQRYAAFGVDHDRHGRRLGPAATRLTRLTAAEAEAYAAVATAGPAAFRRIEQERIPLDDARAALLAALAGD